MWLLLLPACLDDEVAPLATDPLGHRIDTGVDPADTDAPDTADTDTADTDTADTDTSIDGEPVWDCTEPLSVCTSGACAITADARVVTIAGTARFNGDLPDPAHDVTLSDPLTGQWARAEITDGAWQARVSAGDWAVSWEAPDGADVGHTDVHADADVEIALTDTRVRITGTAAWLGSPVAPRDGGADYAVGFVGEEVWGADVLEDGTWEAWLPEGAFDVYLRVWEHGLSDGGGQTRVATVDLSGPTNLALDATAASLDATVRLTTATGDVLAESVWLDGDAAWSESAEDGHVVIDAPVGAYTVWVDYGGYEPGSTFGSLAIDTIDLATDAAVEHTLPLHALTGLLSLDGATLPDDVALTHCPVLTATEVDTSQRYTAPCPGDPSYTLLLPAGTYDLTLTEEDWGNGPIPLADGVEVSRDMTLDLDARLLTVTGSIRYDGGEPPLSEDGSGHFWTLSFADLEHDFVYVAHFEGAETWSTRLPEGRYSVTYRSETPAFGTVMGEATIAQTFDVRDDATLDVDVTLIDVAVDATLEGLVPPSAKVVLSGAASHQAWLDAEGRATLRVPAGDYALFIEPTEADVDTSWLVLHPCVRVE